MPRPRLKHDRYFADVFCGVAHVASSVSRPGFNSRQWDTSLDAALDITNTDVLNRLRQDVLRGKVLGCCLALPCTSFSVARIRTCRLRSTEEPWGLADRSQF